MPRPTVIEHGRFVFFTQEKDGYDRDLYLFADQEITPPDSASGKSDRRWVFLGCGWNYSAIDRICHRAGRAESQTLRLAGGATTPEKYLEIWREAIRCARPLDDLLATIPLTIGFAVLPPEAEIAEFESYRKKGIEELRAIFQRGPLLPDGREVWYLPIRSAEDFLAWKNSGFYGDEGWIGTEWNPNRPPEFP